MKKGTKDEWKMRGKRLSSRGDNYAWAEGKTLIPGSGRKRITEIHEGVNDRVRPMKIVFATVF